MLRVATFNVNGIRATRRRGFDAWLAARDCDVVGLQELRCPAPMLPVDAFPGYHLAYDPGTRAGRSGVAVLTRELPAAVRVWGSLLIQRGPEESEHLAVAVPERGRLSRELHVFADEGRYVEVDLSDQPLTVASLYLPKGGLPAHLQKPGRMREAPDGGARYARKMRFLDGLARQLTLVRRNAAARGRAYLLLGDLNIAHTPQDVANWRANQRSEGFLPEERAWFSEILGPRRLVDVVRRLHPDAAGPYSWWSWMGRSFVNDTGWRIDYHLATPRLAATAIRGGTDREASAEVRMSDHAPVVVDYDL